MTIFNLIRNQKWSVNSWGAQKSQRLDNRFILLQIFIWYLTPVLSLLRKAKVFIFLTHRGLNILMRCQAFGAQRLDTVKNGSQRLPKDNCRSCLSVIHSVEEAHLLNQLAQKLIDLSPAQLTNVFFACSGSEANESAVKIAWSFHRSNEETSRKKIIAHQNHTTVQQFILPKCLVHQ